MPRPGPVAARRARISVGRATRASRPRATRSRRPARRRTPGLGRTLRRGRRTRVRSRDRRERTRQRRAAVTRARVASTKSNETVVPVSMVVKAPRPGSTSVTSVTSQRTNVSLEANATVPRSAKRSPTRLKCSGLARSLASRMPPVTMSAAPSRRPATSGSSRKTSAVATAKSGAVPTVTEVRDAPASRTANVKRICAMPGASRPARTKGQAFARSHSPRATATIAGDDAGGKDRQKAPDGRRDARVERDADEHRHRAEQERGRGREENGRHAAPDPSLGETPENVARRPARPR